MAFWHKKQHSKDPITEAEMLAVGSFLRGRLDEFYLKSFIELVEHNEAVIAFENLCAALDEHEVRITREEHEAINSCCTRLGVDPSWLECIAESVDDRSVDP